MEWSGAVWSAVHAHAPARAQWIGVRWNRVEWIGVEWGGVEGSVVERSARALARARAEQSGVERGRVDYQG